MPTEAWFLLAGMLFTLVLAKILVPIIRRAMNEPDPRHPVKKPED